MAAAAIMVFEKFEILTVYPRRGPICVNCRISSKSVKRLRRYGDLTGFKMAAVRHLGFWKFKLYTVCAVKRPILHNRAKFRKDRSNCRANIAISVIFKMASAAILFFEKLKILTICPLLEISVQYGQSASLCEISSKSVKRLRRYDDLTVLLNGGICRARIGTTHEDY